MLQNELQDGVTELAIKYLTPAHVRNNLFIFTGCALKKMKSKIARTKGTTVPDNTPLLEAMEQKGDLLIHELWKNGTESVHNMHVVTTDVKSHFLKTQEKYL